MKKLVLTFGLISGAIVAGLGAVMTWLCLNGTIDPDNSEVLGYTIMVLSFILVFFAIRSYRENPGAGTITFGKAFQVGILVTLVASAVYVAAWEVVYYNFMPDFPDRYAARVLEKMKAKGESAQAIEKTGQQMARFKELYKNPLFNVGVTFIEVFPVGLAVTLVSAAALRKKTPAPAPSAA